MKQNTHPNYFDNSKVHCACGNEWTTGSTVPEYDVEICSNCHPFYTGKEKNIDKAGRIDRFKKRLEKQQEKATPVKKLRKNKQKN
ncbi:MAG: 50S ribosomal protein L31 [Candidatus Yanofskybacteria bacterium CG10_big_fil_rev_8_21_14_0_10_36_16]|uniref:Large ribosomal subunit protein bL31 n=1 Tax=Candidatus Yanofskybacteria bacterium CG10_big_fil_rev_8_21_14_0_10_36_16 TaxID=1975096 RepID=A0A2J0QC04_9BACT|nr:MAG: 50S ribosomal protein L31 [Candidatus Yanofskybacteria bacterium CG10_big_fil_rev_8_21_14_0_10_36_16]